MHKTVVKVKKRGEDMKFKTLFACLALVFGCASDSLAQFTPVVAKIKIRHYRTQSDGTEKVVKVREGFYYRSSAGDEMQTDFSVNEKRERREPGKSHYQDASTGRIYSLNHNFRKAELHQQVQLPLLPKTAADPDSILGEEVVNGLNCVALPVVNADEKPIGKYWVSLDVDLTVKRALSLPGGRHVWELYDIEFTEPEPSKFGFPSDYTIGRSNCVGCEEARDRDTKGFRLQGPSRQ